MYKKEERKKIFKATDHDGWVGGAGPNALTRKEKEKQNKPGLIE